LRLDAGDGAGVSACSCKVCADHKRWLTAIAPQTDDAKAALDEILSRLEGAETEVAWANAVFAGDWPASIEVLNAAIVRARMKGQPTTEAPK
jgi:hypothetical protein